MTPYILGTKTLIGLVGPPQIVIPSVNQYPILDATDLDQAVSEVEYVLGLEGVASPLWPQGNVVFPGVDIEYELAKIEAARDQEVLGAQPQQIRQWEGTTEDLLSHLDLERRFDESFDESMLRRTGVLRSGRIR